MSRVNAISGILVIAFLTHIAPANVSAITYLRQTRSIQAEAWINQSATIDTKAAPDFAPFTQTASASDSGIFEGDIAVFAQASVTQNSTLAPNGIFVDGTLDTLVAPPTTHAIATSTLDVLFQLDQPEYYSLAGHINLPIVPQWASNSAQTDLKLISLTDGLLASDSHGFGDTSLHSAGLLQPGKYQLTFQTTATLDYYQWSGDYHMNLRFAPIPLPPAGLTGLTTLAALAACSTLRRLQIKNSR